MDIVLFPLRLELGKNLPARRWRTGGFDETKVHTVEQEFAGSGAQVIEGDGNIYFFRQRTVGKMSARVWPQVIWHASCIREAHVMCIF